MPVCDPDALGSGKIYRRLIKQVAENEKISVIDALMEGYNSFISQKIDDYNSSVYYENPSYIFKSYKERKCSNCVQNWNRSLFQGKVQP